MTHPGHGMSCSETGTVMTPSGDDAAGGEGAGRTGPRVYLETFGCQMNELDSELVVGSLRSLGYGFTAERNEADVVLYNTCSVRERAEQKVWSRLGEVAKAKRERPGMVVGVLGCMAERDGEALVDRMPVVDVLCGPGELDKLPALIDNAVRTRASLAEEHVSGTKSGLSAARRSARQIALQGNSSRRSAVLAASDDTLEMLDLSRAISPVDTPGAGASDEGSVYGSAERPKADGPARFSAYVRITRGCNKFCTYCVVPFTRGAEVHRPPQHIVDECKRLADSGVIEITLLGQTVNHYRYEHGAAVTIGGVLQPQKGRTYKGSHHRDAFAGSNVTTFADLLKMIHDEVPSIQRLRFVTSYPRDFGNDVLEVIRDHPRLCRYLHVPAQTGSDRMLKMMNRGYTIAEYDEFIDRCRHFLDQPEIGRPLMLSGDIIVGFPTESGEDFELTKGLLRRARYKNCFIFKYSPRPGTTAYDRLPDDVPEGDKRRRNNELLALQQEISDGISREQIGRRFPILIEGLSRREKKRRGADVKPGKGMVELTIGGGGGDAGSSGPSAAVATPETDDGPIQLAGRTDGDLIVHVESDRGADLIGSIVDAEITDARGLGLTGVLV